MPAEHKLLRCEEDDPDRCQATGQNGQCPYLSCEGAQYCQRHGANPQMKKKEEARQYKLQVWQKRVSEFSESKKIKSLREEIGILRLLTEEIIGRCPDSTQLLIHSSKISELIMKINTLVISCNKMDTSMGMLLDKSSALSFASQIVTIICAYVDDPDAQEAISNEIIDLLGSM